MQKTHPMLHFNLNPTANQTPNSCIPILRTLLIKHFHIAVLAL